MFLSIFFLIVDVFDCLFTHASQERVGVDEEGAWTSKNRKMNRQFKKKKKHQELNPPIVGSLYFNFETVRIF